MTWRLKTLGASKESLTDIYKLFIRSNLEFAVSLWAGAISKRDKRKIERVQKTAAAIILGSQYTDYELALEDLEIETLDDRRISLSKKFGKNMSREKRFAELFPAGVSTRSGRTFFAPPDCNTKRYRTSAIPHIIDLLNSE